MIESSAAALQSRMAAEETVGTLVEKQADLPSLMAATGWERKNSLRLAVAIGRNQGDDDVVWQTSEGWGRAHRHLNRTEPMAKVLTASPKNHVTNSELHFYRFPDLAEPWELSDLKTREIWGWWCLYSRTWI